LEGWRIGGGVGILRCERGCSASRPVLSEVEGVEG
jgi:hypothetical protein